VRAIDDLVRQGKVLYWGVSEWRADQIDDVVRTAEELRANPPASDQPIYNMLNRKVEDAIMPACARHGMGIVVFSPLAQGVLTGKYEPGKPLPSGSRGADEKSNMFMGELLTQDTLCRVAALKEFAHAQGYTLAQFALAWILRRPEISSVIIGASSTEQLEVNLGASGIVLSDDVWKRAEDIVSAA
jgi:L-glyceraldehyde 3-phosphate reductase